MSGSNNNNSDANRLSSSPSVGQTYTTSLPGNLTTSQKVGTYTTGTTYAPSNYYGGSVGTVYPSGGYTTTSYPTTTYSQPTTISAQPLSASGNAISMEEFQKRYGTTYSTPTVTTTQPSTLYTSVSNSGYAHLSHSGFSYTPDQWAQISKLRDEQHKLQAQHDKLSHEVALAKRDNELFKAQNLPDLKHHVVDDETVHSLEKTLAHAHEKLQHLVDQAVVSHHHGHHEHHKKCDSGKKECTKQEGKECEKDCKDAKECPEGTKVCDKVCDKNGNAKCDKQ